MVAITMRSIRRSPLRRAIILVTGFLLVLLIGSSFFRRDVGQSPSTSSTSQVVTSGVLTAVSSEQFSVLGADSLIERQFTRSARTAVRVLTDETFVVDETGAALTEGAWVAVTFDDGQGGALLVDVLKSAERGSQE